MKRTDPNLLIRRSALSIPADKDRFIAKAWIRDADAVTLDLEDGCGAPFKEYARSRIKDSIAEVGKGGSAVIVRINNEPDMIWADLEACIQPGLDCIAIPKVETAEQLREIESEIGRLEKERGLEEGSITTSIGVESAIGYLNMREIAAATTRGCILSLGTEDFTRELGMEIVNGDELLFAKVQMLITAGAYGLQPKGLIGRMTNYKDLDGMFATGLKSYRFGFRGSTCIHPDQISVCNRAFRPQPDEVEKALGILDAMEEADRRGDGATSFRGEMVDRPVAERARKIVERHNATAAFEEYKRQCRVKHEAETE